MNSESWWRLATLDDLDAIMEIQERVHSFLPERREIFADKMRLSPEGCLMLMRSETAAGYGVAHPWTLGNIPSLDTLLGDLPERTDCLYVHDVALMQASRGQGAGAEFIRRMSILAQRLHLPALALVSVYGTYPFWETCGFVVQPSEPLADRLSGYGNTARYMVARL